MCSLSEDDLLSSIFHIFDNLKLFTLFKFPLGMDRLGNSK